MRKRRYAFGGMLASVLLVILAACQGGGGSSGLKIGVVTDVGTLDDHNFNQYSWEGAKAGASAVGAPAPKAMVTTQSADYAKNIQSFVNEKYDIIVSVGFAIGNDTAAAAEGQPEHQVHRC